MNKMRQKWRVTRYGNVSIRVSFKNEPLSFALNHILLAKCEDDLQYSVYNLGYIYWQVSFYARVTFLKNIRTQNSHLKYCISWGLGD